MSDGRSAATSDDGVRDRLRSALGDLAEPDRTTASALRARLAEVLRPPGALRRLDEVAVHMAAWQGTDRPSVSMPHVLVFAGDHGVTVAGVSAYPSDITAAMLSAVRAGRATINALARVVGAEVTAIDVGVGHPTGDIRTEAALTPERLGAIVDVAYAAVDRVVGDGVDLLVLGELGIGNTTAAAAVAAALGEVASSDDAVDRWVGRGAGVDDAGLARKRAAVRAAVARIADVVDPIEVLREVGGAELAAMAAACLRARHHRVPVVLDGFIATAAVFALHAARPGALDHCLAGHRSSEPGHGRLLAAIGLDPLLDLDLRLGEGSGALAAVPLIAMACAAAVEVPTFGEWFG